jgi:hypothetical protein
MSKLLLIAAIATHKAVIFIQDTLKEHPFTIAGSTYIVSMLYKEEIIRGIVSACSVYVAFAVVSMTAWLKIKEIRDTNKKKKSEEDK